MNDTWTILRLLNWCRDFFADKGIATARLDAEVLLAHVLGVDRLGLYLRYDQPLELAELATMRELVRRRGQREPVAHLVGTREFFGLSFRSDRRALVPRPETELLVEIAMDALPETTTRVCDLGTGTGCIAISLAVNRPAWTLTAIDLCPEALKLAGENVARHGVTDRVRLVAGDFFDAAAGPFEAVLSNPPYIRSDDLPDLMPEVAVFDPPSALDGGSDGLAVMRELVDRAPAVLSADGLLAVECGAGQADEIQAMMTATGAYRDLRAHRDLAGVERVVAARRK